VNVAADPLSRAFAALADPIRRDIVARLADGAATVTELAEPYEVTVQAVSKHLKVLEDAGLVSRSREAQRRPVHLEAPVFELLTKWLERYRRDAEERYRRLDDVLRAMPDDEPVATTATAAATSATAAATSATAGATTDQISDEGPEERTEEHPEGGAR
jgi:DNA-binding transcriptional ArsR family regulator